MSPDLSTGILLASACLHSPPPHTHTYIMICNLYWLQLPCPEEKATSDAEENALNPKAPFVFNPWMSPTRAAFYPDTSASLASSCPASCLWPWTYTSCPGCSSPLRPDQSVLSFFLISRAAGLEVCLKVSHACFEQLSLCTFTPRRVATWLTLVVLFLTRFPTPGEKAHPLTLST